MRRINYTTTVDATSTIASETIETLATQKANGNITAYTVEYRDVGGDLILHIWYDFAAEDDLDAHYERMNTALSNLPVSLPLGAEDVPIKDVE